MARGAARLARLAITGVDYPIALTAMEVLGLRLAMGRAQEKVNQKPGAVGGNSTKSIRLVLNVPPRLSPGLTPVSWTS